MIRSIFLIGTLFLLVMGGRAQAADLDCFWIDAISDDFENTDAWSTSVIPDETDRILFDQSGTYTVTWNNNHDNDRAVVDAGHVTWDLNGWNYNLLYAGDDAGLSIGRSSGALAKLTLVNGTINPQHCFLAEESDASGELVVGADVVWTSHGHAMVVGQGGTGTLKVVDGGSVTHGHGWAGGNVGAVGSAEVSGTGSQWTVTGWFGLGSQGEGHLSIHDGGYVQMGVCQMAGGESSLARALVSGSNSRWFLSSSGEPTLDVGVLGTAELTIENGGYVQNNYDLRIGVENGSDGTVNVDGEDLIEGSRSCLFSGNEIVVGWSGVGRLNVLNNGFAEVPLMYVGNYYGGTGGDPCRWSRERIGR